MTIHRRLSRLERAVSSGGFHLPCPECGARGGAEEVRVALLDEGEELLPGCEGCGRGRSPDGRVMALDATVVVLSGLDYGGRDEVKPPGAREEEEG